MSFSHNMKLNHYYLVFLGIVLLGVVSCKSKRQVIRTTSPVEAKADSQLFSDMLAKEPSFATLSSRLNLSISTGTRSLSSKANLKIINNRILQISVQPLFGVEVLRFHIDRDSIIVLDRMNKRYVKESLKDIRKRYPAGFDYTTFQALFTNNLFVSGKPEVSQKDYNRFDYSSTLNDYYLKATDQISGTEYVFTINADDRIRFSHLMDADNNYSVLWEYTDFTVTDADKIFPYKMSVTAGSPKRKLDVAITFSNVVFDEPLELSVSVPDSYSRVALSEIIKVLTSDSHS